MPIIKLKAPFRYAPDGITVIDYPAGEADIDALGAEIAGSLGLIEDPEPAGEAPAPAKKATGRARG
jgi:hypothetical protein